MKTKKCLVNLWGDKTEVFVLCSRHFDLARALFLNPVIVSDGDRGCDICRWVGKWGEIGGRKKNEKGGVYDGASI